MKKLLAFLLLAAMGIALASCGSSAENNIETQMATAPYTEQTVTEEPTATEVAETETPDDQVCCVVTVSVNPEFSLHLNKDGLVLTLVCLNEDAENATAGLSVTGMAADEAIGTILEGIYRFDSGIFETDQPKITVTVEMEEFYEAIDQAIFRMDEKVFAFADSKQIPMGYERRSVPVQDENSTILSDTIDENGNRVVVEKDPDGVIWETVSDGETGQVLVLIRTDPDGTVTYCDMTTNITTVTKPDGSTSQMSGVIGKG